MEIVDVFAEHFFNNNDKPTNSSRMLRVKPKTLEMFEKIALFMFLVLIFLFVFPCFFFLFHFFMFFFFSFFLFLFFSKLSDQTPKLEKNNRKYSKILQISHGHRRPINHFLKLFCHFFHFSFWDSSVWIGSSCEDLSSRDSTLLGPQQGRELHKPRVREKTQDPEEPTARECTTWH